MFEFINYGELLLTFTFFIIAIYLNKGSKQKSYLLIIVTGLIFLYTLFGMPIIQKNKAIENIALYKNSASLSCVSGFLIFGSTFTVNKDRWDLEGDYFIHKQTKESIRTDKCANINLSR